MKKISKIIFGLLILTLSLFILCSCGDEMKGNWYVVEGSVVKTLELDGSGSGNLGSLDVTYEVDNNDLTLKVKGQDDRSLTYKDSKGGVLKEGDVIYAYRDKAKAKAAAADGDVFVGYWYFVDSSGVVSSLDIASNYKASTVETNYTYIISGDTITLSSDSGDATYQYAASDGTRTLTNQDNSSDVLYSSFDKASEAGDAAAGLPVASDYVGTWNGVSATYAGETTTLSSVDMTFQLIIREDGTMSAITDGEDDGSATWTVSNGTMSIVDGAGNHLSATLSDGTLALNFESDDMIIYCTKAE